MERADSAADFATRLQDHFDKIRPVEESRDTESDDISCLKTWQQCLCAEMDQKDYCNSYEKPYAVIKEMDKVFIVRMHGKDSAISIDRINQHIQFQMLLRKRTQ